MLVFGCGTPILQPKSSVNIWNLLWLSGTMIIFTEQINLNKHFSKYDIVLR